MNTNRASGLTASWTEKELPEVLVLLNRALGTWEPAHRPAWALGLTDRVERRIKELEDARRATEEKAT